MVEVLKEVEAQTVQIFPENVYTWKPNALDNDRITEISGWHILPKSRYLVNWYHSDRLKLIDNIKVKTVLN